MVNALKKKMLGFAVVTVLAAALMVGCGNKSKNNSATSPSSGNGATDMPNETELPESTNNAADDAGNAVDDAVDGAGNAVKDATDGVEDAVDDAVDGTEDAVDDLTGNEKDKTNDKTSIAERMQRELSSSDAFPGYPERPFRRWLRSCGFPQSPPGSWYHGRSFRPC